MSKMSELAIEQQNSVIDTASEHSQHNLYQENCSECFKNIKDFDSDDEEEDINYELCKNCGIPSENIYCDTCQKEIENGSDYYETQE